VLLSACATTAVPESNIEDRVMARWDALLSDDLAGAYEYLSPGYRSSVTANQYQRSLLLKKVQWTKAEFRTSECEESVCEVHVLVGFAIYGAMRGVKSFKGVDDVEESWALIGGQWYLVPKQ
jgi:hypothetical protein